MNRGYTQSEVGLIPREWVCTTVRGIASAARNAIVGGPFGSELVSADYVEVGVPVIRGQNMSGQWIAGPFVFVSERKARALEGNRASSGDIVFTQRGTLGQVSLVPDAPYSTYVVSQSQMKVSVDRQIADPLFYYYVFTSEQQQKRIVSGTIQTGVPHINLGILKDIPVQRPPLLEQRAIATALGDVDALLDGLMRLIAKKRDLKQAAMQQLLTGQTRLPGFSAPWEMKRLQELGVWRGGMTPSMGNAAYWDSGSIPWIASGDVKTPVLSETALSITPAALHEGGAILVPANSVVLVTRSGILRRYLPVATNRIAMAINQDVKALTPAKWFHAAFILHTLTAHGDRILGSCLKSGTTVESIEFRWLKSFGVPVPTSIDEQFAIAAVLSDMDAEITALEARRDKTRLLKQAMMQELLTGRTRLV